MKLVIRVEAIRGNCPAYREGDQIVLDSGFLFNLQEKRNLMLSDQSIEPSGQLTRRPTLKNLDKGYDFMPRFGKQVGAKTIIFPCQYRNYICFAKVDFN